jgi:hypothetical protein
MGEHGRPMWLRRSKLGSPLPIIAAGTMMGTSFEQIEKT